MTTVHASRPASPGNPLSALRLYLHRHQSLSILLGGVIRQGSPDLTGPVTEHCLDLFSVDLAFQGADGIGADGTIYTSDLRLAKVDMHIRRIAQCSCLLSDSSKIGRTSLARCGSMANVQFFITDQNAPAAALRRYARQGAKIIQAPL